VYSALEDAVDDLAVAAGHTAYVYETSGGNVKKLLALMVRWMHVTRGCVIVGDCGLGARVED
jgi:hypothetical protein